MTFKDSNRYKMYYNLLKNNKDQMYLISLTDYYKIKIIQLTIKNYTLRGRNTSIIICIRLTNIKQTSYLAKSILNC